MSKMIQIRNVPDDLNASIDDALYIALAEALEAPLLTRDAALARVAGIHTRIEVLR